MALQSLSWEERRVGLSYSRYAYLPTLMPTHTAERCEIKAADILGNG